MNPDAKTRYAALLSQALERGSASAVSPEFIVEFSCWLSQHMSSEYRPEELQDLLVTWDDTLAESAKGLGLNEWLSTVTWSRLFVWLARKLVLHLRIDTPGVPFRRVYQHKGVRLMVATSCKLPDGSIEPYTDEIVFISMGARQVERLFSLYVGKVSSTDGVVWEHLLDRTDLGVMAGIVHALVPGHAEDPGVFHGGDVALWES